MKGTTEPISVKRMDLHRLEEDSPLGPIKCEMARGWELTTFEYARRVI